MAVDNHSLCILGAMDRLWFHQIILFPEPSSPLVTKTVPQSHSFTSGVSSSFSTNEGIPSSVSASASSFSEEDGSLFPSTATPRSSMVDSNNEEEEDDDEEDKEVKKKERPGRLNLVVDKTRSHSSSPSTKKPRKGLRHSRKLLKSMSCKSLLELELEEVKGFMDLGFKFNEHLSPRMMSIVPGLQRLGLLRERHSSTISELNGIAESVAKDEKFEEEDEEERRVMRPYLSEAWLIKRPNSPLLNLKVPRVYAAADMKRHLIFWARMVASEIQQETEIGN
ncbi:hypothetical protein HS088_TW13G00451 [Tripterygium wilfordii]|uniref:Uncharacterized protein n=1 Tax=Tripterygium wilfordii TaxID=458696 RepID=A0A7J7CUJ9_TRIWF|nr:uncharacterized protein LOC120013146 [Tripterygium wilfordii]XP_038720786.1 uncharacterized protein LOC120013146 [Tripterygium wilfordii]XP_038720787.1 uncharacterized protein LOC120013146 [Tripterygium wilfordii]KAF5737566.1 hypothetical protein HS088_TW13G00451 [Tripterygium wilfordii]